MSSAQNDLPPEAETLTGQFHRPRISQANLVAVLMGWDVLCLSLVGWFARYGTTSSARFDPWMAAGVSVAGVLVSVVALGWLGAYWLHQLRGRRAQVIAIFLAGLAPMVATALGLAGGASPQHLLGLSALLMVLPALLRLIVVAPSMDWAISTGLTERRAVLLGGGEPAARLIAGLARNQDNDIRICAIFDDRSGDRSPERVLDVPRIGRFSDLQGFARRAEIDMVLIALPVTAKDRIAQIMAQFRALPLPVHLAEHSSDFQFGQSGGLNLSTLRKASYDGQRRRTKRAFDLVVASLAILALSPVMLAIAVAIRAESRGPILFRQMRSGFNEKPVRVLKFRSMYADQADPKARNVVRRGDPRVTRVGRFIRKTSLDELPQLFNVISGDLSLVGPRPHAVDARSAQEELFEDLVQDYSSRHRLPPGITGWAQINGWRGGIEAPEALEERVNHDLWYIENWSLWLDVKILAKTPFSLLDSSNAY